MSKFTSQHYEAIGDVIQGVYQAHIKRFDYTPDDTFDEVINSLCDMFEDDNKNFNSARFRGKCYKDV